VSVTFEKENVKIPNELYEKSVMDTYGQN